MQIPQDLQYTDQHEWVRIEDETRYRVGITDFAQDSLGDIVYIELPNVGTEVAVGAPFAEIESTKSVAEVFAPAAGTIVGVNEALADSPELMNTDPYGDGWIVVIEYSAEGEFMDAAAYEAFSQ
jgi:glycine cleavage system H protein